MPSLARACATALAVAGTALLAGCGGGSSGTPGNTDPGLPPPANTFSGVVTYIGAASK